MLKNGKCKFDYKCLVVNRRSQVYVSSKSLPSNNRSLIPHPTLSAFFLSRRTFFKKLVAKKQSTGVFANVVNKIGCSTAVKFSITGPKKTNITARARKNICEVLYLWYKLPMLDENSHKAYHKSRNVTLSLSWNSRINLPTIPTVCLLFQNRIINRTVRVWTLPWAEGESIVARTIALNPITQSFDSLPNNNSIYRTAFTQQRYPMKHNRGDV